MLALYNRQSQFLPRYGWKVCLVEKGMILVWSAWCYDASHWFSGLLINIHGWAAGLIFNVANRWTTHMSYMFMTGITSHV